MRRHMHNQRMIKILIEGFTNLITPPHKKISHTHNNDVQAIFEDWKKVGDDLRNAMEGYEREQY
jgi:hypothetical protein